MNKIITVVCCILSLSLAVTSVGYADSPLERKKPATQKKSKKRNSVSAQEDLEISNTSYVYANQEDSLSSSLTSWTNDWKALFPDSGQSFTVNRDKTEAISIYCRNAHNKLFAPKSLTIKCTSGAMNCTSKGVDAGLEIVCTHNSENMGCMYDCGHMNSNQKLYIEKVLCNTSDTTTVIEENEPRCGKGNTDVAGNAYPPQ